MRLEFMSRWRMWYVQGVAAVEPQDGAVCLGFRGGQPDPRLHAAVLVIEAAARERELPAFPVELQCPAESSDRPFEQP